MDNLQLEIAVIIEDIYIKKPNSGASSLIQSHIECMHACGINLQVIILTSAIQEHSDYAIDFSKYGIEVRKFQICTQSAQRFLGFLTLLRDPQSYVSPLINPANIQLLHDQLSELKPDIIWAEHFGSALLASRSYRNTPLVYSQHDWVWLIQMLKNKNPLHPKFLLKNRLLKGIEEHLVKKGDAFVSGSKSDNNKATSLGAKLVGFFPTIYESVQIELSKDWISIPRIVHLGSMKTTANRLGLERFMDVVWPDVKKRNKGSADLWIIGDLSLASQNLKLALESARAFCTGYIEDLSSVLRPFDIQIIPWEYDTGTRTRIPLALSYGQVIVSTEAAAACYQDILVNGYNCLLVKNLNQMSELISLVLKNPGVRKQIGINAKKTFEDFFTLRSQIKPMAEFINLLMK